MSTRLVLCCLGNPGRRYADTRHNLGFRVADALVAKARGSWSRPREEFDWSRISLGGRDVIVIKPLTYMNLSGEAIEVLREIEPVDAGSLTAVCDDIALPLGTLRLRAKGSDGGHNGLKSLIATLETQSFARLRLGVGPVPESIDPADFVLDAMSGEDLEVSEKMVRQAVKCVQTMIEHGISAAMDRFNTRPRTPDPPGGEE